MEKKFKLKWDQASKPLIFASVFVMIVMGFMFYFLYFGFSHQPANYENIQSINTKPEKVKPERPQAPLKQIKKPQPQQPIKPAPQTPITVEEPEPKEIEPDISQARDALKFSSTFGDYRSPDIQEDRPERDWIPNQEALNDPLEYEKQQKQAHKDDLEGMAVSAKTRIQKIEEKIEAAKNDGSRSQAEIDEATEAMNAMKELEEKLEEYKQNNASENQDSEESEQESNQTETDSKEIKLP